MGINFETKASKGFSLVPVVLRAILHSELKGLHKNDQNFYSRCLGSQEIARNEVETVLMHTFYGILQEQRGISKKFLFTYFIIFIVTNFQLSLKNKLVSKWLMFYLYFNSNIKREWQLLKPLKNGILMQKSNWRSFCIMHFFTFVLLLFVLRLYHSRFYSSALLFLDFGNIIEEEKYVVVFKWRVS